MSLAFWSASGRQERLWRIRKNFSPGNHTLTKKPKDSGYEIGHLREELSFQFSDDVPWMRILWDSTVCQAGWCTRSDLQSEHQRVGGSRQGCSLHYCVVSLEKKLCWAICQLF